MIEEYLSLVRVFAELAHMFEGLHDGFLDCILRVFAVMRNVFRNPNEFEVITLHEFFKGRYISVFISFKPLAPSSHAI
jgi:hypothetical protein